MWKEADHKKYISCKTTTYSPQKESLNSILKDKIAFEIFACFPLKYIWYRPSFHFFFATKLSQKPWKVSVRSMGSYLLKLKINLIRDPQAL